MTGNITADWIAVDWGTTNLRVWAMGQAGALISARETDQGVNTLDSAALEPVLLSLTSDWLPPDKPTLFLCCGMIGSRLGWIETPYRPVPTLVTDASSLTKAPTQDARLRVLITAGVKQAQPPDVMRGEETQIAGFLKHQPDFDGVLCLPGTHTKWARISAGELVSFTSFMTGELFSLLANQSVLRPCVAGQGWDSAAFDDAVSTAQSHPARVASDLFSIRAASLIDDLPVSAARARLSGLLIGQEITAAKPYWLGMEVVILGDDPLASLYQRALKAQGLPAATSPAKTATLDGLRAIWAAMHTGGRA